MIIDQILTHMFNIFCFSTSLITKYPHLKAKLKTNLETWNRRRDFVRKGTHNKHQIGWLNHWYKIEIASGPLVQDCISRVTWLEEKLVWKRFHKSSFHCISKQPTRKRKYSSIVYASFGFVNNMGFKSRCQNNNLQWFNI